VTSTTPSTTNKTKTVPSVKDPNCWSEPLGYYCCSNPTTDTIAVDANGLWGVENGQWCGRKIPEYCWALRYDYPCCKNQMSVLVTKDEYGKWSFEDNNWCGLY